MSETITWPCVRCKAEITTTFEVLNRRDVSDKALCVTIAQGEQARIGITIIGENPWQQLCPRSTGGTNRHSPR